MSEIRAAAEAVVRDLTVDLLKLVPDGVIEHVGATALTFGATKGDVDVNLRISADRFREVVALLESRYEVAQPANWTATFASFSDPCRALPVGIQVTAIDGAHDFLVALRELMLSDPELLQMYDDCKRRAAPLGTSSYWQAKDAFLRKVLSKHGLRDSSEA